MQFDLAMTDELLATTRTVRKRLDLDRAVPRETILECLAARGAGADRLQPAALALDRRRRRRRRRRGSARSTSASPMPTRCSRAGPSWPGRIRKWRAFSNSFAWLADNLGRVPAMLIPCIEGRPEPDWTASRVAAHWGSILPAVWSFQLALRARGLGSALTTLHLNEEAEVARLLGVPDGIMQVALLPVAYTRGTDFRRAARMPLDGITHWNAW